MMLICLIMIDLRNRINKKYILGFMLGGYLIFSVLGNLRANSNFLNDFNIKDLFVPRNGILINQESDVDYSSVRVLSLTKSNIITEKERNLSFLYFIESIFYPSSKMSPLADLSLYKQHEYKCGGGGLISSFFFVFLSYFGVVIIAYIIANIFNNGFIKSNSLFQNIFYIFTISTIPRWLAYYPITLFKLSLLGSIIVYVLLKAKIRSKIHIKKIQ